VIAKYEMNFFFKLARAWNARLGEWTAFPDFLQLVYAQRVLPKELDDETAADTEEPTLLQFPRIAA
jgi:hypothetical protein